MPTNRKILGAAAFSLALAGGGVAGAVLGTPDLSLAQDSEDTAPAAPEAPGSGLGAHRGAGLEAAADAIGISEDDLRAALADGQSIAQVADAEGVDVQDVIDALVTNGTERLEGAIAELPDRMSELVEREGLPERGGRGGPGHFGGRGAGIEGAAEAIGISDDELRAALRDGSTIAEVATANDVEVNTVIEALVADANERLDAALSDERITQAQADERKADLEERMTALVNGERPAGGPRGGPDADVDTDVNADSTAA